jgi:hypothetical protein
MKLDYPIEFLTILLAALPYLFRVYWDYFRTIAKQKPIGGRKGYRVRLISTAGVAIAASLINYAIYQVPIWQHWFLSIGIFFLLFDITIALLMGKHWLYIGDPKDDASWYEANLQYLSNPLIGPFARILVMMLAFGVYYHLSLIIS